MLQVRTVELDNDLAHGAAWPSSRGGRWLAAAVTPSLESAVATTTGTTACTTQDIVDSLVDVAVCLEQSLQGFHAR